MRISQYGRLPATMWVNPRQKRLWQEVIETFTKAEVVEYKRQVLETESIILGDGLTVRARQEEESQGDFKLVMGKMVVQTE